MWRVLGGSVMTWVKLSDTALDEPFLLPLSRGSVLLHLEALAYSNRYAVDGVIHRAALRKLTTEPDPEAAVAELVDAGLWEATASGWQLVWLLDDQPTSREIHTAREQARTRQERKRLHGKGQHHKCEPDRCKVLLSRRDTPRDIHPPPTRPSPTLPDRKGEGEGSSDGDFGSLTGPVATQMEKRRILAKAIREAPSELHRKRFIATFIKEYGHLYPARSVAA